MYHEEKDLIDNLNLEHDKKETAHRHTAKWRIGRMTGECSDRMDTYGARLN
jgi:hypothetical protein